MKNFFILIFLLSLLCNFGNKNTYAQNKIEESFEGNEFPPLGWSVINSQTGGSEWVNSGRVPNSGSKCAVSNFSSAGSANTLVTKRFKPVTGDSLVFYFRQTFWNVFKDTFVVLVSNSDSLFSGAASVLFRFYDGVSYPVPFNYGRFAAGLDEFAGQTVWLGFQHINANGDNIRLDDISAGQPGICDVGIETNICPAGSLNVCSLENLVPAAVIRNYGTMDQSIPFNITYSITGAVNYNSVKQDIISIGSSKIISFDTAIINVPGNYNVKIYSSLNGDQNTSNDTLNLSFTVVNPNFGGGEAHNGNYYFANSTSCSSPASSQPEFCWKDTTGSKSLILENQDVSGGILTGNVDNGYFSLGNFLSQGHKIKFFNSEYDSVFISTNGVIGFIRNDILLAGDHTQIQNLILQPVPLLSPLWMDLDFENNQMTGSRLSYKVAGNQLIITFTKAPLKLGGSADFVSFQVCIESGISLIENSKLLIQYDQNSTGENFLSSYVANTLPFHMTGIKGTDPDKYIMYRLKDSSGITADGTLFNSSVAVEFGSDSMYLNSKCSQLDITVLLEAIYPNSDSLTVLLRDAAAPYNIFESKKIFPDSSGFRSCSFTIPDEQYSYYLVVKHRNSIETWSKSGGEVFSSNILNYDFSTHSSKAFGNNMLMRNGKAFIYCGDVNQDNVVDGDDIINVSNSSKIFSEGYVPDDVNNDRSVDLDDVIYAYNNSSNFVISNSP